LIGTVLDKYEVLQKVGEGGMATVYLGRHATLGRDVAIKVLHPHLSSSQRNRKRFAREARAIEHLRHENILEIFDYSGTDSSDCFIVTEFVEGETLAHLISRVGRLPSEVAAAIGASLAGALAYAHSAGILHRDLKPDNVMIRRDGTVKLMDFGIARFLDESQVTMTGALVGSPAYMSPEQAREGDLDARSDLFSLGTLLYHAITGSLPFPGSNPSLILKNIIEGNRPTVAELSPQMSAALADVIERCMQSDREGRFSRASDVQAALQACLDEVGFSTAPPEWAIARFLSDPDDYRRRLEAWLGPVLLARGKEDLAKGDHLAALRLFNRLLTLDEDNAEVLALIQGLHENEEPRRRSPLALAGLALVVAAVAAVAMGWFLGRPEAIQPEPIAEVPVPATVAVAEDPTPVPLIPVPVPAVPMAAPEAPATRSPPSLLPPKVRERLAATPPPSDPAEVQIRTTQPYVADILEGGARLGDVRQAGWISVPAGEHLFVLRGPGIHDYELRLAVAPGERRKIVVEDLRPRPVEVAIDPAFPATCDVLVNGVAAGSLGALGYEASLPDPQASNIIVLDCGDDGVFRRTFDGMASPYLVFTRSGSP